jgi:hypothetical protein
MSWILKSIYAGLTDWAKGIAMWQPRWQPCFNLELELSLLLRRIYQAPSGGGSYW